MKGNPKFINSNTKTTLVWTRTKKPKQEEGKRKSSIRMELTIPNNGGTYT